MIANRLTLGVSVACGILACVPLGAQTVGDQDITGPYRVVENWLKPMPWHADGLTFGLIAAVYPDTPDRIFVLQGGDLPDPRPARGPGPRSNADHIQSHFVLVLNRDGEFVDSWTQWDHLFVRPHKGRDKPLRSGPSRMDRRRLGQPDLQVHQRWIRTRYDAGRAGGDGRRRDAFRPSHRSGIPPRRYLLRRRRLRELPRGQVQRTWRVPPGMGKRRDRTGASSSSFTR